MKGRRAATLAVAFCALMVVTARTAGARGILRTAATGLTATALLVKDELLAVGARTVEAAQDVAAEVLFRHTSQGLDPTKAEERFIAAEPESPAPPAFADPSGEHHKTGA